jgi:protein-S-isoprenylcysteine O-methyltransferase Ste14
MWGWAASPFGDTQLSASELIALVTDPVRQRSQFVQQLAVASCLILACGSLGVAVARLPRERLRRFGRAAPTVGLLTLVTLVFVALVPSGLTALLGSFTNMAVAALLVLGGYAWVVGRAVRRHGAASIAAVGATVLATAAWLAVDHAWRSWPQSRNSDGYQIGSVSVAVETGPYAETAVAVAALLLGTALTVLACARLSTADSETR